MRRYHVFAKIADAGGGWLDHLQSFDDLPAATHHAVICPYAWAYVVDMETEKIVVPFAEISRQRRGPHAGRPD